MRQKETSAIYIIRIKTNKSIKKKIQLSSAANIRVSIISALYSFIHLNEIKWQFIKK